MSRAQGVPLTRRSVGRWRLRSGRSRSEVARLRATMTVGSPSERQVRLDSPYGLAVEELHARLAETTVRLLMDDSGSMYGPGGDPTGVRYAAGRSIAGWLGRNGGGQLGVIHWGSNAPHELAVPPCDVRLHRRRIRDALVIPPTLGGNNLSDALRLAARYPTAHPGGADVTIVITDGMEDFSLDLRTPMTALPPASVHILLVDRSHGCDAAFEENWRALPLGSFTRLDDNDVRHMTYQIAELICREIGAHMPADS